MSTERRKRQAVQRQGCCFLMCTTVIHSWQTLLSPSWSRSRWDKLPLSLPSPDCPAHLQAEPSLADPWGCLQTALPRLCFHLLISIDSKGTYLSPLLHQPHGCLKSKPSHICFVSKTSQFTFSVYFPPSAVGSKCPVHFTSHFLPISHSSIFAQRCKKTLELFSQQYFHFKTTCRANSRKNDSEACVNWVLQTLWCLK